MGLSLLAMLFEWEMRASTPARRRNNIRVPRPIIAARVLVTLNLLPGVMVLFFITEFDEVPWSLLLLGVLLLATGLTLFYKVMLRRLAYDKAIKRFLGMRLSWLTIRSFLEVII